MVDSTAAEVTQPKPRFLAPAPRAKELSTRLEQVRGQTAELRARALEVADRARAARDQRGLVCHHVAEVEQVQQALAEVEAELAGLRTAMRTRAVIEQAKGMLMAQRRIDADAAFDLLVDLSQTTHRKLVDVATVLVDSW